MNKSDLVAAVAQRAGMTKTDTQRVIDAALEAIGDQLSAGESVTLPGFGSFSVTHRSARQGRNPATGETISIPASRSPSFKAGAGLKKTVNG